MFLLIHNPVRSELGNENIPARNQGETPLGHYHADYAADYTKTNLAWIQSLTDNYFTYDHSYGTTTIIMGRNKS